MGDNRFDEEEIGRDLESLLDPMCKNMTVNELLERYLKTRTGVRPTEKMRQAVSKEQMKQFLKFIHDDNVYCKYYEVFYVLFHTGMRISEFCGLKLRDVDMKNKVIDINH